MAEKQDMPMNAFKIVSNTQYVYVELADGSQGKMLKTEFLNNFVERKMGITIDCNEIKGNGYIAAHLWKNGPMSAIAILETIAYSDDWIIQRFSVPGTSIRMFVRSFYNGTTWSEWKSITLT